MIIIISTIEKNGLLSNTLSNSDVPSTVNQKLVSRAPEGLTAGDNALR